MLISIEFLCRGKSRPDLLLAPVMQELVKRVFKSFRCPLAFSSCLRLTKVLCDLLLSPTLLPRVSLFPELFYSCSLKRFPRNEDAMVAMLKEVSATHSLSSAALMLAQV